MFDCFVTWEFSLTSHRFPPRPGPRNHILCLSNTAIKLCHCLGELAVRRQELVGKVIIAPMSDVTRILSRIEHGDSSASEQLLPLVYEELRKLAAAKMAQEKPGQTLQATSLVHEAYIKLVRSANDQHWDSRGHFFAAAAEAMRRILVDQARRKRGPKAGGRHNRIAWSDVAPEVAGPNLDLLALDEALNKLHDIDARAAKLVKLRFFAGLNRQEAAEMLGVSIATADNDWAYAKAWLQTELSGLADSQS